MALHVIFGAGQVGASLARTLLERGQSVRVVRRSDRPIPGVEVVCGDASDSTFARRATEGAAVVYHCMNPALYRAEAWERELPALLDSLIGAALAQDARLVYLDNLYAYGPTEGRRDESTPRAAEGRKGRLRAALEAKLAGTPGLRWAAGRAGDFFGPGTADNSLISPALVAGLRRGKAPWLVGEIRAPHAFSYVPDVVAGLAALGMDPEAAGVYHLPVLEVAPAELVRAIGAAMGRQIQPHAVPAWAVRALGPVVPLLGELRETLYQWDRPFLVDDARFRARYPGLASTLEQAAAGTAA